MALGGAAVERVAAWVGGPFAALLPAPDNERLGNRWGADVARWSFLLGLVQAPVAGNGTVATPTVSSWHPLRLPWVGNAGREPSAGSSQFEVLVGAEQKSGLTVKSRPPGQVRTVPVPSPRSARPRSALPAPRSVRWRGLDHRSGQNPLI